MAAFRRLVLAALCAGLVSGVLAAAAHQIGTVPLILEAETYEAAAQQHAAAQPHAHPAAADAAARTARQRRRPAPWPPAVVARDGGGNRRRACPHRLCQAARLRDPRGGPD